MLKKNAEIELEIQAYEFPNKGIGVVDGECVCIKNTLVGQKIRAVITKARSGKKQARFIELLQPSPIECVPKCAHFGLCGGCVFQNIPYEQEHLLKEKLLRDLLAPRGCVEVFQMLPTQFSIEGYRNKAEFSFGDEEKGGALSLGMRKKDSFYEVVTVSDCNIFADDFKKVLLAVLDYFQKKQVPFYHKAKHEGVLRHLVVRRTYFTKELLVNLVTTSAVNRNDLLALKEILVTLPLEAKLCGILHTQNDGLGDVIRNDSQELLFGQGFITEKLLGLSFKITAFSFFQTNSQGAEQLYTVVRDLAGDVRGKLVFDLYCGTGTITQIMAQRCKRAVGIELNEEAVQAAKENAVLNGLTNAAFIAGDVLKVVDSLQERPDLLIVDPPREGIHPKAIGKIIDYAAKDFIYVSCNPQSLVRDLEILQQAGYQVQAVRGVDMFCRTAHVESVVLLSRE